MIKCPIPNIPELYTYDKCIGVYFKNARHMSGYSESCTKEEKDARQALEKFQFLGAGVDRRTYLINRHCVIKLARDPSASDANIVESRIWNEAKQMKNPLRMMLLPVYHVSKNGAFTIVPRVNTNQPDFHSERFGYQMSLRNKLRGDFSKLGLTCGDFGGHNVGMYGGRPILIDYGFGFSCDVKDMASRIPDYWRRREIQR